jgi:hypothetical protein
MHIHEIVFKSCSYLMMNSVMYNQRHNYTKWTWRQCRQLCSCNRYMLINTHEALDEGEAKRQCSRLFRITWPRHMFGALKEDQIHSRFKLPSCRYAAYAYGLTREQHNHSLQVRAYGINFVIVRGRLRTSSLFMLFVRAAQHSLPWATGRGSERIMIDYTKQR